MKCDDCENKGNCKDKADNPLFYGCTSGKPSNPIIKPCPFCGKIPSTISTHCKETGYNGFHLYHDCDVLGMVSTYTKDTEEKAIKVWNKRMEV